jgi:hypothetical protein
MGDFTGEEPLPLIDGDGDGDGGALLLFSDRYRSRYAPANCFPTSQWPDKSIVCRHDRRCWSSASATLVCWPAAVAPPIPPPDDADGGDDGDDVQ